MWSIDTKKLKDNMADKHEIHAFENEFVDTFKTFNTSDTSKNNYNNMQIDSPESAELVSESEDDKQLIEEAKNGDSLAITLLVIKYRAFLDKYVGLLNVPLRYKEDFIQEGLIGLLKAVRSYEKSKGCSFSTYAWRCIKNSVISELRKFERRGIKNEVSMDDIPVGTLEEVFVTSEASPENKYIDMESSAQLHDTIFSVLSTYEAQVFAMYLSEISYSLIASRLGKDVKSIDNAIQRIKNKLKKLI